MKKTIILILLFGSMGLVGKAQAVKSAVKTHNDTLSKVINSNMLFIGRQLKPAYYTFIGNINGNIPAMRIGVIDSTLKTWVHIDPKQIHWVNDSTFYIQHPKP